MKDFFEAIGALIDRSWHLALGLFAGCIAILGANANGVWPLATVAPDTLTWVGMAALLCAGIVVGHLARWAHAWGLVLIAARKEEAGKRAKQNAIAMSLKYLTEDEQYLLRWLFVRERDSLEAYPYAEPVGGLVRKGLLIRTDRSDVKQVLMLHPAAHGQRELFMCGLPKSSRQDLLDEADPIQFIARRSGNY